MLQWPSRPFRARNFNGLKATRSQPLVTWRSADPCRLSSIERPGQTGQTRCMDAGCEVRESEDGKGGYPWTRGKDSLVSRVRGYQQNQRTAYVCAELPVAYRQG